MKPTAQQETPVSYQDTQQLAYQLWQEANCPSGQDLDFWLKAEQQLSAQSQASKGQASTTPGNSKSNGARSTPKAAKRAKN